MEKKIKPTPSTEEVKKLIIFARFVSFLEKVSLEIIVGLAGSKNRLGKYNEERLEYLIKLWNEQCKIFNQRTLTIVPEEVYNFVDEKFRAKGWNVKRDRRK